MNRKKLLLMGAILVCTLFALFFTLKCKKKIDLSHLANQQSYFIPIKITKFHADIPYMEIKINNVINEVSVDLGSGNIVALPAECLQQIDNKSHVGSSSHYGIRGKKYQCDRYLVPKVDIGKLSLYNVEITVSNPELIEKEGCIVSDPETSSPDNVGTVGWKLFSKVNLLLDCEKSLLAFCDGWETLKKQGYSLEDFVGVPFVLDKDFIEFEAITADGPLHCIIDTGCTHNILNKDLKGDSNEHMILNPENINKMNFNPENTDKMVFNSDAIYEAPTFIIGKGDFGPVTFDQIKMPYQLDAFLGMEFLYSRPIFIDFLNHRIYFSKKINAST